MRKLVFILATLLALSTVHAAPPVALSVCRLSPAQFRFDVTLSQRVVIDYWQIANGTAYTPTASRSGSLPGKQLPMLTGTYTYTVNAPYGSAAMLMRAGGVAYAVAGDALTPACS